MWDLEVRGHGTKDTDDLLQSGYNLGACEDRGREIAEQLSTTTHQHHLLFTEGRAWRLPQTKTPSSRFVDRPSVVSWSPNAHSRLPQPADIT